MTGSDHEPLGPSLHRLFSNVIVKNGARASRSSTQSSSSDSRNHTRMRSHLAKTLKSKVFSVVKDRGEPLMIGGNNKRRLARLVINSSVLVLFVIQSLIITGYLAVDDPTTTFVDNYYFDTSNLGFIMVDIVLLVMIVQQFSAIKLNSQPSNVLMIYMMSMAFKVLQLNQKHLLGNYGSPLLISNSIGFTMWNANNAVGATMVIYWLLSLISIHNNFDSNIIARIPECCVTLLVSLKVTIDILDVTELPQLMGTSQIFDEQYHSLHIAISTILFCSFFLYAFSGYARSARIHALDSRLADELAVTSKYTLMISIAFVDLPAFIVRFVALTYEMHTTDFSKVSTAAMAVKNILALCLSGIMLHQLKLIELDQLRSMFVDFEKHIVNKIADSQNLLRLESKRTRPKHSFDETNDEEALSEENDLTSEERKTMAKEMIQEILAGYPGIKKASLNSVLNRLTLVRRLPLKSVPSFVSVPDFVRCLLTDFSHRDLSSLLDMGVDNNRLRCLTLSVTVLLGLLQPFTIFIIEVIIGGNQCHAFGEGVSSCYRYQFSHWEYGSDPLVMMKQFFCIHDRSCYLMYVYLGLFSLVRVALIWFNSTLAQSLLHALFMVVKAMALWKTITALKWIGIFRRYIRIDLCGFEVDFHAERLCLFFICIPSLLSAVYMNLHLCYALLGAKYFKYPDHIRRTLGKYDLRGCLWYNIKAEKWSKHNSDHSDIIRPPRDSCVDLIQTAVYIGCRFQVLPAAFNELLIGPDMIKALRLIDLFQITEWYCFWGRCCFRLVLLGVSVPWTFWTVILLDLLFYVIYSSQGHVVRLLCLKRSEVRRMFEIAIKERQRQLALELKLEGDAIDATRTSHQDDMTLLTDVEAMIRQEGLFSDYASIVPIGLF